VRPTVLVGLGGAGGWHALAWATEEASATGARMILLHACEPGSALVPPAPAPSLAVLELVDPPLARAVARTRERLGGHRVHLRLLPGRPGPLLVTAAAQADLVVIGPPGRWRPGGFGGTAHHVAAHAPRSVVVVRPATAGPDAPLRGHIVVGVDERGDSDAAVEFAFERAVAHACPIAAVHVSGHRRDDYHCDRRPPFGHASADASDLSLLAHAVEPWTHKHPHTTVTCAVYAGRPLPGLLRAAHGARLLVIGDHGHSRLGAAGRGLLGGVIHGALDHATGPVAIVRAHRREGP